MLGAARARVRRIVRVLGGRRLVNWLLSRLRPTLSVVMPVYNVAAYLAESLDSVLTQSLARLELIAVDDGSTDESLAILRDYARRDPRVRVLTQANAGQGAARNLGVGHARGEFLTFIDSDDTLPHRAFEQMVASLRASGSDFVVGGVRRFRNQQYTRMTWQRTVHQVDRIGTTIEEFPAAMQDIIACNRVFRTAFWRDRIGGFRGGIAYEDHVPMLAAYVRASSFDVLAAVTYNWRIREDNTSTGQQKSRLRNLTDRIEVKEEARTLLLAEASPFVYDVWVARCLEVDFPPYIAHALDADTVYRDTLAAAYRTFTEPATDRSWDLVRVFTKVRAFLVAAGRWDDVAAASSYFLSVHQVPPTRVVDGVLVAELPTGPSWTVGLPRRLTRLAALESHFEGVVQKVRWLDDEIELTGWMRHRGLDVTSPTPELTLSLRFGDRELRLAVEHLHLPEADLWAPLPYAGCAPAGFRARAPLAALTPDGRWHLTGAITTDGLVSSGTFHDRVPGSSGADPEAPAYWDSEVGFAVDLRPGKPKRRAAPVHGPRIVGAEVDGDRIVLRILGGSTTDLAGLRLDDGRTFLDLVELEADGDGVLARFSTLVRAFGSDPHPAPSGSYLLRLGDEPVGLDGDFRGRLPLRLRTDGLGITIQVGSPVRVVLAAPLADDELGRYRQRRLQDTYASSRPDLRDAILLVSDAGRSVGDSQLALDRRLAAERPGIERIWGVADLSVVAPSGARSVLIGSRDWYAAAATSRWVAASSDLGPWFRTQPGQASLQTFGGHPSEAMGLGLWRSEARSPGTIQHALAVAHGEWDLVLAPSTEVEGWYREQFAYDGPVLVAGAPRTDVLVTADAAQVRADVLARLGVPADRTVVLVAVASAALDLPALARHLGPGCVLLARGLDPVANPSDSVVDVTLYPELHDLVLAADAAVLDYSSLRFDVALTGHPMVFWVPDRATRFVNRPPLVSFEESAPGPWAASATEVADALGDLPRLRAEYRDAISAFNQRFNALADGHATERVLDVLLDPSTPWRG